MCGEHLSKCAINMKMRLEIPVVEGRQAREKNAQKKTKNIFSNRSQRNSLGVRKTTNFQVAVDCMHLPISLLTLLVLEATLHKQTLWESSDTQPDWNGSIPILVCHILTKILIVPCVPLLCNFLDHVCRLCRLKLMIRCIIFMATLWVQSPNSCWLKSVVSICLISRFLFPQSWQVKSMILLVSHRMSSLLLQLSFCIYPPSLLVALS